MDEYCGYEVDDVYSGEVLDEVMCEVCGTIQPVENKICSYCGAKIQSKEAKKARKKKRKKESGDYVPARKKINRKPPSKPAAENTMEKPKPMEKPTPMERPKPIERPTPIVKPKPVDIPKPIEKPKPVDIPKPIEKPKPVEFPKPAESPKPVDSFAQRLAEIHNSVKLPEDVADEADEADFEMPDVLDRTPRHSVSINKPDLQKPEPIINPPRPAVSISNMNSQKQDNSPLMSRGIDGEERYSEEDLSDDLPMDDYIDEGENENERLKLALKLTALVLFIMIGIVVMVEAAELKSRQREKMNLSNYSAPVTYYDDGNVSLDYEDQELLEVGKDFPADEYFFSSNDTYGGGVVVWDSKIEDVLCVADVNNSLYLTLKEGQFLMSVNCDMYRLEKSFKENDPFACPGMFKVGFDLEAGTYNVVPYGNAGQYCVRVHKESVYDMDSFLGNFLPENGKIKVKKGDYLELDNCILEKE